MVLARAGEVAGFCQRLLTRETSTPSAIPENPVLLDSISRKVSRLKDSRISWRSGPRVEGSFVRKSCPPSRMTASPSSAHEKPRRRRTLAAIPTGGPVTSIQLLWQEGCQRGKRLRFSGTGIGTIGERDIGTPLGVRKDGPSQEWQGLQLCFLLCCSEG